MKNANVPTSIGDTSAPLALGIREKFDFSKFRSAKSNTIELRPLGVEDVSDTYLGWLEDPKVNRFLEVRFHKYDLESLRSYVAGFDFKTAFIFGIFSSSKHIGNLTLYFNPHHGTISFGYIIGDRDYWGSSAATETIVLALDFAFDHLGARKVWGNAYRNNVASIFNFAKFGFVREGVLRGHLIESSGPVDSLVYGLLIEEWQIVKEKFSAITRSFK